MAKISKDKTIIRVINQKKIITIDTLTSLLNSSVKTARRRLKLWEAITSYNENGRYYTLPGIPVALTQTGCGTTARCVSPGTAI